MRDPQTRNPAVPMLGSMGDTTGRNPQAGGMADHTASAPRLPYAVARAHGLTGPAAVTVARSAGLDFDRINAAALGALPLILPRWLPDGRRVGSEWVARNPTRADRKPGSFKVSLASGRWSDFATGAAGGDAVSLAAYLFGLTQAEAARRLANMLGVPHA